MAIGRISPTKGNPSTKVAQQGHGIFYRAAASGITNTGIKITVNNQQIGLMYPNDNVKLNERFDNVVLEPVDTNNTADIVTFDTMEDYFTAAVSGTVSVNNFPEITGVDRQVASKQSVNSVTASLSATVTASFSFRNNSGGNAIIDRVFVGTTILSAIKVAYIQIHVCSFSSFPSAVAGYNPLSLGASSDLQSSNAAVTSSIYPLSISGDQGSLLYQPTQPIVLPNFGGIYAVVNLTGVGGANDYAYCNVQQRRV